jgi:hypothetical protein
MKNINDKPENELANDKKAKLMMQAIKDADLSFDIIKSERKKLTLDDFSEEGKSQIAEIFKKETASV